MTGAETAPRSQVFSNLSETPQGSDVIDAVTKVDNSDSEDEEFSEVTSVGDATAIPKGTIDPVYEAKARVLNHAVCPLRARPSNQAYVT
jgi:hypothetical protein